MQVAEFIRDFTVPSLPRAALHLLELIQDPNVDIARLGVAIELDPALAGRIVRLANSSLFGLSREVTSIRQALVMLGLRTIKVAALSFTFVRGFQSVAESKRFGECWRRILVNAMACRLASGLFGTDPEESFLAGLLQDIGVLVLAQNLPERYFQLLGRCHEESSPPLHVLEQQEFGVDHADIAATLLKRWQLPSRLIEAVGQHHHPIPADASPTDPPSLTPVMVLAEGISHFLLYPTSTNLSQFDRLSSRFGENSSQIDKFLQTLELQVEEVADMLSVDLPPGESYESILRRASSLASTYRIYDRNDLLLRLQQEMAHARRQLWPVSVVMMKVAVDTPNSVEPSVLKRLIHEIECELHQLTRECDSLFRFTSDTFCLVAPNTPAEGAEALINRIRANSFSTPRSVSHGGVAIPTRPVFGVCAVDLRSGDMDAETVLHEASQNLVSASRKEGIALTRIPAA